MKANLSGIPPGRGLTLWERITSDPRYLEAKQEIRARYGLPLAFDIHADQKKWSKWLGRAEDSTREEAERGQAFLREVHALFKRFEVPEAWHSDFIADIAGGS